MSIQTVRLGEVLHAVTATEPVRNPAREKFLTVKLYGRGVVQRSIKDGKTPLPFTGYRVRAGQFIYSRIDARNGAFGIVPAGLDGAVVSKDFPAFDIDTSEAFPDYLRWFTSSPGFYGRIQGLSFGATNRQRVQESVLLNLRVPLPPIDEQRRIAAVLDQGDALRARRREAKRQLDELTRSIFLDMFGDTTNWATVAVADVAAREKGSIRTGPFGSQLLHSEFTDQGVAVLGIDNAVQNEFAWSGRRFIAESKYRELKRYTVHPGDVLVTIMATCGRCAIVPDDIPLAINTKHLCCITLDRDRCLPGFLHAYFLIHPTARQYLSQSTKGAIMAGLNMGIIKSMPIPLAPLPLQREYACRIAAIERLKDSHRAHLAELNALFGSLQSRAFRGEL